jgi:hypothetical protein
MVSMGHPPSHYILTAIIYWAPCFVFQFCDVAQVGIIHNLFSQIWQYSKYEIPKS